MERVCCVRLSSIDKLYKSYDIWHNDDKTNIKLKIDKVLFKKDDKIFLYEKVDGFIHDITNKEIIIYFKSDKEEWHNDVYTIADEEYELAYLEGTISIDRDKYFREFILDSILSFSFDEWIDNMFLYQLIMKNDVRNKTACIMGLKPVELYGYHDDNKYIELFNKVVGYVETLIMQGYCYFITNGNIGSEQLGFNVVEYLKSKYPHIKNILAVPFRDFHKNWPIASQNKYLGKVEKADMYLELDTLERYYCQKKFSHEYKASDIGKYNSCKYYITRFFNKEKSGYFLIIDDKNKPSSLLNGFKFELNEASIPYSEIQK